VLRLIIVRVLRYEQPLVAVVGLLQRCLTSSGLATLGRKDWALLLRRASMLERGQISASEGRIHVA